MGSRGHSVSASARRAVMSSVARPGLSSALPVRDSPHRRPRRVAVIGAGAAGLVAARELRREGLSVVVFERRRGIGGTWLYDAEVEEDPLGLDTARAVVHSSLYDSLRTNLPRECMGFFDYPFVPGSGDGGDSRRFPCHQEVLRYLEDFARDFDLCGLVRFETEVMDVEMTGGGAWAVRSRGVADGGDVGYRTEIYDGVVVCNGHYTEPRVADIPGIDVWPGKQMHSHNYRVPQPFIDQVVVVIGNSSSAFDISRDISGIAKEVHIASRSQVSGPPIKQPGYDNMWHHTMISHAEKDGTVVFLDGTYLHVDVILHCTGYKYHFPFLKADALLTVDDNRVGPLYKHIFPPSVAPWLSFIGIPWKVSPFPMMELQSKWVAGALSGRIGLPEKEDMMREIEASYTEMEAAGWPKRYAHNLSSCQFEYDDWLATQCGHPAVEEWRKQMYHATSENREVNPEAYRDEWEDHHLIDRAVQDFRKVRSGV